ncbi:extracellular solute-binding protein [Martelella sp. HB161492]|uniref:ABC transporter substrate-binding protein n=1 Tax=Martelella sp. HB161492 TaxID=2720726 RepID=UPI001592A8EE|nr:extracellular solute-binding protein [Martelella sp. HB161492]
MKLIRFTATAALSCLLAGTALAQTTVNVLSLPRSNESETAYFEGMAKAFEASHPGVDVNFTYLDDEALKSRLPTLLQSDQRPEIFYSWGGGVFQEQAKAGVLEPLGPKASEECLATHPKSLEQAFTYDGTLYGLPLYAADVVIWYNKDLAKQAGIDPESIKTWDQFLAAVEKAKAAGVTPIVVGGKDKWPLQTIYSLLLLREAGGEALQEAADSGDYSNPAFLEAAKQFVQLVNEQPFQPGFMDATYDKASGLFGDGKGLFHIMGNFDYVSQSASSTTGKGLSDDQLGLIAFPAVEGGAGDPAETLGGNDGFVLAKGAGQDAADFLCFMLNVENQREGAAAGYWIPAAIGASDALKNPFFVEVAKQIENSPRHQLYLDQALGTSVGSSLNDIAADLATGVITPEDVPDRIAEAQMFQ